MKSIKHIGKLFGVIFSLLGLGAIFTSCNKERDCTCTYSYTYLGTTFTEEINTTVEGKCETLELSYDGQKLNMDCEES